MESLEWLTLVSPNPKGSDAAASCILKQNPHTARPKGDGGRWGVVPASEHQEILVALASSSAQRYEMADNS